MSLMSWVLNYYMIKDYRVWPSISQCRRRDPLSGGCNKDSKANLFFLTGIFNYFWWPSFQARRHSSSKPQGRATAPVPRHHRHLAELQGLQEAGAHLQVNNPRRGEMKSILEIIDSMRSSIRNSNRFFNLLNRHPGTWMKLASILFP